MKIETRTKYGWKLELDRAAAKKQLVSDDPGNYAPVMVIGPNGESATGFCALDTGECEYTPIPDSVYRWLDEQIAAFWESLS